jgi:phage-related protein
MKTILTILSALFTFVSVNAQGNFDTAIQTTSASSGNKINSRSSEQTLLSATIYDTRFTDKKGISIMPNGATNDVKIIFKTDKAATGSIAVLDERGKNILQQNASITTGNNNININDFHKLSEGTYTIQLISNNETYTSSFMIWK